MQRPFAAADDDGWPKTCVMANPHAIAYQFGGKKNKQASPTSGYLADLWLDEMYTLINYVYFLKLSWRVYSFQ